MEKGGAEHKTAASRGSREEEGFRIPMTNLEYTPGAEGADRAEPGPMGKSHRRSWN